MLFSFSNILTLKNNIMKKTIHVSNQGATLDTSRRNFLKLSGVGLAMQVLHDRL
jgi:hypothetical protein